MSEERKKCGGRAANQCNWCLDFRFQSGHVVPRARVSVGLRITCAGVRRYVPVHYAQESKEQARSGVIAIRGPPQETEVPDYPPDATKYPRIAAYSVLYIIAKLSTRRRYLRKKEKKRKKKKKSVFEKSYWWNIKEDNIWFGMDVKFKRLKIYERTIVVW